MENRNGSTRCIEIYLREIGTIPRITPAEEIELARRIQQGDEAARALMIKANLRLVVKIARSFIDSGLPLLDLISEGNIGLMKAVERFQPGHGAKLSTYAAWWIKQTIRHAIAHQVKTIRLPVYLGKRLRRLQLLASSLAEVKGREPTNGELAERAGWPEAEVSHLLSVSARPASLDAPLQSDEEGDLGEIIGDEQMPTPFHHLRHKSWQHEVRDLLGALEPREADILRRRFGLDGEEPETLDALGQRYQVTRERVRQLQNNGLATLRDLLRQRDTVGCWN